MALLYRNEINSADNPKLDLYVYENSTLTDLAELKFRIFDITTDINRNKFYSPTATPADWDSIQEYPATPGEKCTVNVDHLWDDEPTPGHKLGIGHYFAPWQVPETATPGSYVIVWEYLMPGDLVAACRKTSLEFVVSQANYYIPEETIADDIREFMRDYAFSNELIDGFESTDAQIQRAINLTIKRYNMLAPRAIVYENSNFPVDASYIVIMGSVGHLLKSISLLQLRNQLTYTDGGVHVGITDKHQLYRQAGLALLQEFDTMAKDDKITRNLDAAWGNIHSPYHGYYTFYGV